MIGRTTIIRGTWITIVGVAASLVASAQQPPVQPSAPDGSVLKDAPKAYLDRCVYCHDAGVGPVLRGRGLNANYVALMVRNGMRAMPAFRSAEVDDKQIAELGAYLSQVEPGQKPVAGAAVGPANAEKGKAIYQQSCVTCHGSGGRGTESSENSWYRR